MTDTQFALAHLQEHIAAWCREQFPEQTGQTILAHLREEVAELRERGTAEEAADCLILLLAYAAHTGVPLLSAETRKQSLADLTGAVIELYFHESGGYPSYGEAVSALAHLLIWAAMSDVDLLAATEAKHAVNLTRQWRRGADGIHRHVPVEGVQS